MSPVGDPSLPTIDVGSTTGVFCPDLWTDYKNIIIAFSIVLK